MLFAGGAKGISLDRDTLALKVVDVEAGDWQSAGVLVHDPKNRSVAHMLVEMPFGAFPTALGVIYEDPAPTFESAVIEQNAQAAAGKTPDLQALVSKGQSWEVTKEPHVI
jgi:2-oxoglutarate ferredoxin oxidoreductase subunit beta